MTNRSGIVCDCTGAPPWPEMLGINVSGELSRFYLCRQCSTVREDKIRPDGTIIGTRWHDLESVDLPAAVVEQVREILDAPRYGQLGLFEGINE